MLRGDEMQEYEKQGYWIYDEYEEDYVYIPSAEELAQ
jgi:hypothetical protein